MNSKDRTMEYLKRAEEYAQAQGGEFWFKNIYTQYRESDDVTEAVWKTLSYMYTDQVADMLEAA
jgi:hypothetical protein